MGAAAERGFPALCSAPAPSAHGRHVISCSFFAPPIISAPGSAHGGALPPVSHFSHLRWPCTRASQSHFPVALPGHFGATFPRCGSCSHAAPYPVCVLNQTFMFSPGGFQAQTVCTVRRPTARAKGAPAIMLGIIFLKRVMGQSLQGNFRQWCETEPEQKGQNPSLVLIYTASCKHWEMVPSLRDLPAQRARFGSCHPETSQLQTPVSHSWARATTGKAVAPTPAGCNSLFPKSGRLEQQEVTEPCRCESGRASDAAPNSAHQPPPRTS